jgi:hypothetical protein
VLPLPSHCCCLLAHLTLVPVLRLVPAQGSSSLPDDSLPARVDSRPAAKYLDGQLTQIGTMSLTGDQRFLVLNGSKTGSTLFIYDSVAQEKMITKVDVLKLEKLEIANKMVGTSLIIKEKDRSAITFYAHDPKELTTWGVAIALNYLACLPSHSEPADGVSEQLRQKALASTKQSDKQIDDIMEQVYSTIGNTSGFNTSEEDVLLALQSLLSQLRGFDMNSGAQRNDLPGIASLLVKNGVGKAKESFGLIIIAVEHLVQPMLENWQELKPRIVMEILGWIMDFEELLSDFSIELDSSAMFSRYCLPYDLHCKSVRHFPTFTILQSPRVRGSARCHLSSLHRQFPFLHCRLKRLCRWRLRV